jgi:predicted Rossmann fold nucleotide-binding protein DprA/Smf involved in DNA uptake
MLLRAPALIEWRDWKIWYHGRAALLDAPLNALLCSRACPGKKIIEAIDLAQRWRAENRAAISGFHTPVEKECLRVFLRGPQPLVICPARGIDPFQLPADWQPKFKRGELLIASPFDSSIRRPTKETADARNRFVISLSHSMTVIYASPGGLLSKLLAESQTH